MITLDEHLRLLRTACWSFRRSLGLDLDDLVHSAWIQTRLMTQPNQIHRAATNLMISLWRHRRLDLKYQRTYSKPDPGIPVWNGDLELNEIMALTHLGPLEKELILMRFYRDLPWSEIETLTGFSRQHCSKALRAALNELERAARRQRS